jgi:hypothetical protein
MTRDEIIAAWNAQSDYMNSWQHLGEDEKLEWAMKLEREACADKTGEFARKWWSIHCDSNKHMETTRKAHDDFCALQAAIRNRRNT